MTIKTRKELIKAYLEFFKKKKHKTIPNSPLVPEHDPTVLFTTAGMHPLVPHILGQPHAKGNRLANNQKCIRTGDIEEVGNETHLTFFEMLGNWSLGEYWKEQAIEWSYEFLTEVLKLSPNRLHITCFKGDKDAPRDTESEKVWQKLGIPKQRIYFLGRKDNWWGPAGKTGPCGPCTEMFYDTGKRPCKKSCNPACNCGKYFELWNDVFMEYNLTASGSYKNLKQKTVDTGMGVERTIAMLQNRGQYETEIFKPITDSIKTLTKIKRPKPEQEKSIRIISDHIKAACFILAEKVIPSNLDRGYVLRRLIRRTIRHARLLGLNENFTSKLSEKVFEIYKDYSHLKKEKKFIQTELDREETKFRNLLEQGLKKFDKISRGKKTISGKDAFLLFQSYGFPLEMTSELAAERKLKVNEKEFQKELRAHQETSRKATSKRFKSGLADTSKETTKLHTATHLLHTALRKVLGAHVEQKGSNITTERLRFDFSHNKKLTSEQIRKVEQIVNNIIKKALPIKHEEMTIKEARQKGALAFFDYKGKISVYNIGDFSMEVCAGPHVANTRELGKFRILKEESIAAGVRRIKAVLG